MISYEKIYNASVSVNNIDEYNSIATILDKLHISSDSDDIDCIAKYGEIFIYVYFESETECEAFEAELKKINK